MTTGDVKASVAALHTVLRSVRFPGVFDTAAAEAGNPAPLLPALDYLLLRCSKHVAHLVSQQGLQLQGKNDLRFIEGVFKFTREALGIRPPLTPAQFLAEGFAERKVQLVHNIAKACKEHHNAAARKERLAALKGQHTEQRLYAGAAEAPALSPDQQQREQRRRAQSKERSSKKPSTALPRPPPLAPGAHAAPVLNQSGGQDAGAGNGEDGDSQSSRASEAAAAVTPTSVVAAAAAAEAGAGCRQNNAAAAAAVMQQLDAAPGHPCCAPSPVDQPRSLPPSLLLAHKLPQHYDGSCAGGGDSATQMQPERGFEQGPAVSCSLQVCGYPQLKALAAETGLLQTTAAQSQQAPARQLGSAQLIGAWRQEPLPQQPPYQKQQPPTSACFSSQQANEAKQAVPQQQAPQCVEPQLQAQHLPGLGVQVGSSNRGSGGMEQQQTQRLIQELQLRLNLAEEAAAAARQDAQQAREHLQARVTVLEGRVRFLEAGYELRPPQQSLQLPHAPQQTHAGPALPWGSASVGSSRIGGFSAGLPASHAAVSFAASQQQVSAVPGHPKLRAPFHEQQQQQLQQPWRGQQPQRAQHTRTNPLFNQPPSVPVVPVPRISHEPGAAEPPVEASAASSCSQARFAVPMQQPHHAVGRCAGSSAAQERGCTSTSEFISGMQARFLEAENFLLRLQQL